MKVSLLTQIAPKKKLLERLVAVAEKATSVFIAVSFIQRTGLKHLFKSLTPIIERGGETIIYTSGYLMITEPVALEDLLRMAKHYPIVKAYFNSEDRFHSKFLLFKGLGDTYKLFLGSSNISVGGLSEVGELNAEIGRKTSDRIYRDIQIVLRNLKKDKSFEEINKDSIKEYVERYKKKSKYRKQILSRKNERKITSIRSTLSSSCCFSATM